jgi:hypothetical protein
MLWVTRAGGNVDRVACLWLIKRFIDKDAQFLYVPADKVLETAKMLEVVRRQGRGVYPSETSRRRDLLVRDPDARV